MIANISSSKVFNHAHQLNHHFNKPSLFNNHLIGISCASSFTERPKWLLKCDTTSSNSEVIAIEEEEGGKRKVYSEIVEEREVLCEVEVVSWRERRIKAEILVCADIQSLWDVLTDYDRLAEFIPNLVTCKRVDCPHPGRIWLEQRGLQRALYWKIEALVLLDLQEILNSPLHSYFSDTLHAPRSVALAHCIQEYEREIHFSLVEGDFEKFEGKWSLKTEMRSQGTTLSYELTVVPKFKIPAIILEKVIRAELPANLLAVARRAESDSDDNSLPE